MTSIGDYGVCDNLTVTNLTATNLNFSDGVSTTLRAANTVTCNGVLAEAFVEVANLTITNDSSLLIFNYTTAIQATKIVFTSGSAIATVDYAGKSNILAPNDTIEFNGSTISLGGGISWANDIAGEQTILSVGANAFTFNMGKASSAAYTNNTLLHNMTFDVYYSLEMMPALSTGSDTVVWTRTTAEPTTSFVAPAVTS